MPAVLHVDDEPMVRRAIGRLLEHAGMTVCSVGSSAQALAAICTQRFDLVLVDRDLGAEDGLALIVELRRRHPDLCLLLLTGALTADVEERATELGATRCLSKTTPPRRLMAEVAAFAGGSGTVLFGPPAASDDRDTG